MAKTTKTTSNNGLENGKSIICGVAPGWIFSGTIVDSTKDEVTLTNAAYIENLSAPWPEAAKAGGRKNITKFSSVERLTIRLSAMLWHSDFHAANTSEELAAIERSK